MSLLPLRTIGTSELNASVFSLGSWHVYDRMQFEDVIELLAQAVQAGINLFDVGVYSMPGKPPVFTDVLFASAMRAAGIDRKDYLLSEKLWLESWDDHTGFRAQLERALVRVDCTHSDLVIVGDLRRQDIPLRDIVLNLADLTRQGIIRAWGVNNWSASTIQQLIDIAAAEGVEGPVIAQLKYSVARRSIPEGSPFSQLWKQGLSMQASDVLEGGYLAGKITTDREVGRDPGDIRQRIIHDVPEFVRLAERLETTPAQLAIAFTLTHPATVTTLFGASSVHQLTANLESLQLLERIGAAALREFVEPFWADRTVVNPEGP